MSLLVVLIVSKEEHNKAVPTCQIRVHQFTPILVSATKKFLIDESYGLISKLHNDSRACWQHISLPMTVASTLMKEVLYLFDLASIDCVLIGLPYFEMRENPCFTTNSH